MGKLKLTEKSQQLTVIDFFCGAGGFSEGFRQQGYKVIMGIDNWEPAINTHNLNHGLSDKPFDIQLFWGKDSSDTHHIDQLPDADVIVGSSPCVSFSMSNKAGKADKSLGVHLIKTYLRVLAVKKHAKNSRLKAWLLENVPNSRNYIEPTYTFKDLNLAKWAAAHEINPNTVALNIEGDILCSYDYGAPQSRKRFVCGEIIGNDNFPYPNKLGADFEKTLGSIKELMPSPLLGSDRNRVWQDPNYPSLRLKSGEITDHFYDTGLAAYQWEKAKDLKTYHPFMGKMSFPENQEKPSRTVTATRSGSTRESLIFKSETMRKGNGEYRLPTIREAATLMGYPYVYQFLGSENTRWKLIGNSVSPQLSFALAGSIKKSLGYPVALGSTIQFDVSLPKKHFFDLRNQATKDFKQIPRRPKQAKFRRVIVKEKNTTLELLNYHPRKKSTPGTEWYLCIFKGTGQGYRQFVINDCKEEFRLLSKAYIGRTSEKLKVLMEQLKVQPNILQEIYEADTNLVDELNPVVIVKEMRVELVSLTEHASLQKSEQKEKHYIVPVLGDIFLGWRQGIIAAHFASV